MALERKHQQSVNTHTLFQNGHNQGVANGASTEHAQTPAASGNDNSPQQPSQPYNDGLTHLDTLTNIQPQASGHAAFQYISRPWAQDAFNSNTSAAANEATPAERWQTESIQDQPWHAIEGVYLHDGGDMNKSQQDNSLNNDGRDGVHRKAEDMYSMVCNTSDLWGGA
jgi:hypothetical protein